MTATTMGYKKCRVVEIPLDIYRNELIKNMAVMAYKTPISNSNKTTFDGILKLLRLSNIIAAKTIEASNER